MADYTTAADFLKLAGRLEGLATRAPNQMRMASLRGIFNEAAGALRLAASGGVPEGWQVVPKEPTEDMARRFIGTFTDQSFALAWTAALAAAPEPPK